MNDNGYGLWFLVVFNSALVILFAVSFFHPRSKRDWRVFGAAGIYKSALRRSITPAAAVTAPLSDDVTGLVLGAGVLYRVSGLDLRGYVREFGATDRREGTEIGFGVQRRF